MVCMYTDLGHHVYVKNYRLKIAPCTETLGMKNTENKFGVSYRTFLCVCYYEGSARDGWH